MFDLKDGDDYYGWARQHPVPTADRLRLLLARRMVREGMIDQALPYFPAEADPRFARMRYDAAGVAKLENDASRGQAAAYAAALREAGNGWGRTGRAQAWHQAGLMARRHGMEIMGYEEDPDYAVYDGSYTYGAGRNYFLWTQEHGNAIPATPAQRAEAALPGPYVTQQERERYAASEARPYARFHYRQIAASHMMKAADELPARSQAYAAVLCQGTRFVINDAPDVAAKMYRRYVETGAVVPFSGSFGQECAEPDFKGAARFHYVQAWKAWERLRHDHPGRLLAAGLLALAAPPRALRCGSGARARRAGLSSACVRPRGRTPLSGPAPRPAAMPHPFSPGRARPPAAAAAASWPRPARAGAGRVRSQPCR